MRGLFNRFAGFPGPGKPGRFNPPCGCVAFSTIMAEKFFVVKDRVSIRLADAWPFQLGAHEVKHPLPRRFNPPCGCVAFSTSRRARAAARACLLFQSALRMRGLFNEIDRAHREKIAAMFQSALRMRGLFNRPRKKRPRPRKKLFQSALRMRGLFNRQREVARIDAMLFQSALRMRGLFNCIDGSGDTIMMRVSIRLADAWPFQPRWPDQSFSPRQSFNPPCGCVAFSTRGQVGGTRGSVVSIRLADAWPFQHVVVAFNPNDASRFQSALRMRGLFNSASASARASNGGFQSALRMRGLFNYCRIYLTLICIAFQSALRMRGLFNPRREGARYRAARRFNPPCGCVAFSTPALATASGRHGEALLREARPERRAAP